MFHWEGETAAAKAAEHPGGALYGLSSLTTTGIAEIEVKSTRTQVFRLYVWDRELVGSFCAGRKASTLALTVDLPGAETGNVILQLFHFLPNTNMTDTGSY
jgi:isopentenyl diphosphate isomerase/L-lactate dehydrogenase-like FMN-dependent dehydrogenase